MKKPLFLLLSLALLLSALSGCGQKDDYRIISDIRSNDIFRYEENLDGGFTIRSYMGTDTQVVIPETLDGLPVTRIGTSCFRGDTAITSVTLPNSVICIEIDAFKECTALTSVILSESLTKIEKNAFKGCTALSSITLPSSLTSIGGSAFESCTSLKHITIPGNVTEMGDGAFWKSGLETLTLCEGLTSIGSTVFAETQLRSLTLPSTMRSLGWQSFTGCQLTSVTLNEGLTTLEGRVFSMNRDLPEIVIPKTVTVVTDRTFSRCDSLTKILFEGNAPETFKEVNPLTGTYVEITEVYFTIYYHAGATGFTSPEWFGYSTELW